jgi:hypothetical protein
VIRFLVPFILAVSARIGVWRWLQSEPTADSFDQPTMALAQVAALAILCWFLSRQSGLRPLLTAAVLGFVVLSLSIALVLKATAPATGLLNALLLMATELFVPWVVAVAAAFMLRPRPALGEGEGLI